MAGRYREFPPPAALAGHLVCAWTFRGQADSEPQRVVPDGHAELIVHLGTPYAEPAPDGAWRTQPALVFAGQLTRPLHLKADGPVAVVAARFHPAASRGFADAPMPAFTDLRRDWREVDPGGAAALLTALRGSQDETQQVEAMFAHVAARAGATPVDAIVAASVAALQTAEGRLKMETLAADAGLSLRQFERRFLDVVGVSPRTFASILRFRRVFERISEDPAQSWSEAAQAAGYFDQPQMTRDFRRFLGCTPRQFAASLPGLGSSLAGVAG